MDTTKQSKKENKSRSDICTTGTCDTKQRT